MAAQHSTAALPVITGRFMISQRTCRSYSCACVLIMMCSVACLAHAVCSSDGAKSECAAANLCCYVFVCLLLCATLQKSRERQPAVRRNKVMAVAGGAAAAADSGVGGGEQADWFCIETHECAVCTVRDCHVFKVIKSCWHTHTNRDTCTRCERGA